MEERPIDRGWAWMICLGVGINSLFLSGPLRSYGILFVEISRRFDAGGSMSAIVLAMISVGMAITSPIAATLGERYGQRIMVFVAGLLNFTAAFLTAFAPNVVYICVIFGLFTGLGLGCMFAPAMVMIGYYFDKRRSLANGISLAGGSIGQMTIPVMFTYLLETYSFQGGLLIFSALLLHICIGAMLLRPITCYKPVLIANTEVKQPERVIDVLEVKTEIESNGRQIDNIPVLMIEGEPIADSQDENKHLESALTNKTQSLQNLSTKRKSDSNTMNKNDMGKSMPLLDDDDLTVEVVLEKDLFKTGSFYLLPHQTLSPDESETNITTAEPKQNIFKSCLIFFVHLYDWKLFKDPVWLLYALSVSTGQAGYMTTCMFLPAFATEKGIDPYFVSFLLSIAGATTLFGRIGGGAFADLGLLKRYTLASICTTIIGVAAFIQPFVPYYPAMCGFACILGFVGGVYVAQIVAVVIELMGIKKMSSSFGLALMVSGLIQIPVPIILGILKDYAGTYDWSMYVSSFMLLAGAASLMAAGRLADKKKT